MSYAVYDPTHSYVGPEWFHSKLREWLSRDFNKPAFQHDIDYLNRVARRKADVDFLRACLDEAGDSEYLIWKAVFYFTAVRLFGWTSKKRSKN